MVFPLFPLAVAVGVLVSHANLVNAGWTGWVNSYDNRQYWEARPGYLMRGIESMHHNYYEDRLWAFNEAGFGTKSTGANSWTSWANSINAGYFGVIDDAKVFTGMESYHSNYYEDRRFKFKRQSLAGFYFTSGCHWNGFTDYDARWVRNCNPGEGITGIESFHDNSRQDRIFRTRCCKINACPATCRTCVGSGSNQCTSCHFQWTILQQASLMHGHCRCPANHWGPATPNSCRLCPSGLEPNSPRRSKCIDIDECARGTHRCNWKSTCKNGYSTYSCICKLGYTYGDGRTVGTSDESCTEEDLKVKVDPLSTALLIDASGNAFSRFQVLIAVWDASETVATSLTGYPKETAATQNFSFSAARLPPGTSYRVTVLPYDSAQRRRSWSQGHKYEHNVRTLCSCTYTQPDPSLEKTGKPQNLVVKQHYGIVRFEWTDQSMCEEAFSFYRGINEKTSFTADYYYVSSDVCGRVHSPDFVVDDIAISKLPVGSAQSYCVSAVKRALAAPSIGALEEGRYSSDPACSNIQIQWEAALSGRVVLEQQAGSLPVEGVEISYVIGDKVSGFVKTDAAGKFHIHIKTSELVESEQALKLEMFKRSGDVEHRFLCDGLIPCKEKTMMLRHLSFDQEIEFIDDTSVAFSGTVHIDGTQHQGLEKGCPLFGVQVCLVDHNSQSLYHCDTTDGQGRFSIPAVIGLEVETRLSFKNGTHTFERVPFEPGDANAPSNWKSIHTRRTNPSQVNGYGNSTDLQGNSTGNATDLEENGTNKPAAYMYKISEEKAWEQIDFIDTTTATLHVEVVGGKCNRLLGNSQINILYANCPTWSREQGRTELMFGITTGVWTVPAHNLNIQLERVERDGEVRGEIRAYFGALLGEGRWQSVNLENYVSDAPDAMRPVARFEYHPKPTLGVKFSNAPQNDCTDADGNMPIVLPRDRKTTATITIIEDFGTGVPTCDVVHGNISIHNGLGETSASVEKLLAKRSNLLTRDDIEMLSLCHDKPCIRRIKHDDWDVRQNQSIHQDREETAAAGANELSRLSRAHVDIDLIVGEPNINAGGVSPGFPYTKLFRVTMAVPPHDPVEHRAKVVVVGSKPLTEKSSVAIPEYTPLLVLHDPPGGNSYAEYVKATSTFTLSVSEYEAFQGHYGDFEVSPLISKKIEPCAGVGAMVCKVSLDMHKVPFHFVLGHDNSDGSVNPDKNKKSSATFTLEFSYKTSQDVPTAGRMSDMYLIPSLNIVFMETRKISFNLKRCQAEASDEVEWTLGPGDDGSKNRNVFTWVSELDIEEVEIPNLEKLLQDAVKKNEREKIAKLQAGLDGWRAALAQNSETMRLAKANSLVRVPNMRKREYTGLAPKSLIDMALPNAQETSAMDLGAITTIRFSGGGSSMSYHATDGTMSASTGGTRWTKITTPGNKLEVRSVTIGLGVRAKNEIRYKSETKASDLTTTEKDMSGSIGFTLGDPDTGDVFDVDVFIDPNYGTFVFSAVSGYSMCPSELGTEARERPGIKILSSPLAPTMPNDEATFELLFENNGWAAFNFQAYTQLSENQDGLRLTMNGVPFTQLVYSEMAPGSIKSILKVKRGPTKFKYEPFTVGFRSLCDATMNMVDQNLGPEHWADQRVPIRVEFLQPCSKVELADALASDRTFTINRGSTLEEHRPNQMRIVARNPEASERSWSEDSRLEKVRAEYRARGDFIWSPCLDVDGQVINFIVGESSFGFSTAYWFVGPLPDGEYELRLRTICNLSPGEVPLGMDGSPSMSVSGLIDRDAPQQFGPVEPADGVYFPGDALAVRFDEKILCERPFRFNAELQVDGVERKFDKHALQIVCEQRAIQFAFKSTVPYNTVMGRAATLLIDHVEDLAKNLIAVPIKARFRFGEFQLEAAPVEVSGVAIEIPYVPDMAYPTSTAFRTVASDLAIALSTSLDADPSRFEVVRITPAGEKWIEVDLLVQPGAPGSVSGQTRMLTATGRGAQRSATAVVNDLSNLVNSTRPLPGILAKAARAPLTYNVPWPAANDPVIVSAKVKHKFAEEVQTCSTAELAEHLATDRTLLVSQCREVAIAVVSVALAVLASLGLVFFFCLLAILRKRARQNKQILPEAYSSVTGPAERVSLASVQRAEAGGDDTTNFEVTPMTPNRNQGAMEVDTSVIGRAGRDSHANGQRAETGSADAIELD